MLQDLLAKLREMFRDCDKHKSKKDRQVQRGALRQVLATIEEGEYPEETFAVGHSKVTHPKQPRECPNSFSLYICISPYICVWV